MIRSVPRDVTCPGCGQLVEVRFHRKMHSGEHRLEIHHTDSVTFDDPDDALSILEIFPRCSWSKAVITATGK